jgi:hypothetical protein
MESIIFSWVVIFVLAAALVFGFIKLSIISGIVLQMKESMAEMTEALKVIGESKRLSTIFLIEGKKGLDISLEDFEPKREEIRQNMLDALEEKVSDYSNKSGRIKDSETLAYVVLDRSGFENFVDSETRNKAKQALARVLANQNISGAKALITTLARNL